MGLQIEDEVLLIVHLLCSVCIREGHEIDFEYNTYRERNNNVDNNNSSCIAAIPNISGLVERTRR